MRDVFHKLLNPLEYVDTDRIYEHKLMHCKSQHLSSNCLRTPYVENVPLWQRPLISSSFKKQMLSFLVFGSNYLSGRTFRGQLTLSNKKSLN